MNLTQFAAQAKLAVFEEIKAGGDPTQGTCSADVLREGRTKGEPVLGTTRYEPDAVIVEIIFPNPGGGSILLPIRIQTPERIVHLPIPKWVVESIWQGDIAGSYHFESDARRMVEEFTAQLEPEANAAVFAPRGATRRE
jgi:hypothetical protein